MEGTWKLPADGKPQPQEKWSEPHLPGASQGPSGQAGAELWGSM